MKINKKTKLIGAALVIAAIAFAGTASTAALTVPVGIGATLGFDTSTVTGGTVIDMHYNLSSAGSPDTITSVTVVVVDPARTNGNLVPQLGIRLGDGVSTTAETDCGTGVQSGGSAGVHETVPGLGDQVNAAATSVVTFTCTGLDTASDAVNALTLTSNNLTIQNV
jgi:hypothetical protein